MMLNDGSEGKYTFEGKDETKLGADGDRLRAARHEYVVDPFMQRYCTGLWTE